MFPDKKEKKIKTNMTFFKFFKFYPPLYLYLKITPRDSVMSNKQISFD